MSYTKEYFLRVEERNLNPNEWHEDIVRDIQNEREAAERSRQFYEDEKYYREQQEMEEYKRVWYEFEDANDYVELKYTDTDDELF